MRAMLCGLLFAAVAAVTLAGEAKKEEEVWLGFDEMPEGCPDALTAAHKCNEELMQKSAALERKVMKIRKDCYKEKECRPAKITEADVKEKKHFNPNVIAGEIQHCIHRVVKKAYGELVGDCLGGPGYRYPLPDHEGMPSEQELAFEVFFDEGAARRRRRSPEEMESMMMMMGNETMGDIKEAMEKLAEYARKMEMQEAVKASFGTLDHLFDCREVGDKEMNLEKRVDVAKCIWDKMEEHEVQKERTDLAIQAMGCFGDLPRDCKKAYKWRSQNYCYCSHVFEKNPGFDHALSMCVPSIYHEYSLNEVKKNVMKDLKHGMCKKKKEEEDFDIDEYFEEQMKAQKELMKAIMSGDVDMEDLMEKSMEMAQDMMEDGSMMEMMEGMMEEMQENPEMMMKAMRKMEMMEKMDDDMMKKGKGKGMLKMMAMKKKKKMMMMHHGGGGGGGCDGYNYGPPEPPMCGDDEEEDNYDGYGRMGKGYGRGGYGDDHQEDGYGRGGHGKMKKAYSKMKSMYGKMKGGYGKHKKGSYGDDEDEDDYGRGYGKMKKAYSKMKSMKEKHSRGGYGHKGRKGKCRPKPRMNDEHYYAT